MGVMANRSPNKLKLMGMSVAVILATISLFVCPSYACSYCENPPRSPLYRCAACNDTGRCTLMEKIRSWGRPGTR